MKTPSLALLLCTTLLSGCLNSPRVMQGEYADISPKQSIEKQISDQSIRWSGVILQTLNNNEHTCFEIIETQTADTGRPLKKISKESERFLACKEGSLAPFDYNKRLVTITGNVVAFTEKNLGEHEYTYPIVDTDLLHVWHDQRDFTNHKQIRVRKNEFLMDKSQIRTYRCQYTFMPGACI